MQGGKCISNGASSNVYAYLEMDEQPDDPIRQRIFQVFENMEEFDHELAIDISSIFSGYCMSY